METKVREATNNEPWGAPTTLMAQIAAGTYNYREREEILSFVFRRFTEKAANEWRQIYKALQLLDYLIKNGSERIIDDVRANLSLIQMLKSFHYIDSKGRDQGINVRNRLKNLIALLNDDALIRSERKKARANAKKFGGVSSAAFGGASSLGTLSSSGFGADEDFNNRVYGDGGVFGARYDDTASAYDNGATGNDNNFEEYDVETPSTSHLKPTTSSSKVHANSGSSPVKTAKEPSPDLLGDLLGGSLQPAAPAKPTAGGADDDEFDDFQSAPLAPAANNLSNNLANLYISQPQTSAYQPQPSATQQFQAMPTYTAPAQYGGLNGSSAPQRTVSGSGAAKNDAFSSLFSTAKSKTTPAPRPTPVSKSASSTAPVQSSQPSQTSQPTQTSQSGEIDLLSF